VRRRRRPQAEPAAGGPLLGLAALAVLSHPALDWLNTYGIRLLSPFSGHWFYGDAVFIIDPWIWLGLGGVLFLGGARTRAGKAVWLGAGLLGTVIMLGVDVVPWGAKVVWSVAVAALASWRIRHGPATEPRARRLVRGGGIAVVAYMAIMALGSRLAERHVRAGLEARGIGPIREVMVGPTPADPFRGTYIASTAGAYYRGSYAWLRAPRVRPEPDSLPRVTPDSRLAAATRPIPTARAIAEAARADPHVQDYLVWARFPYYQVIVFSRGFGVRVGDARFEGEPGAGSLAGVIVRLDDELRLVR
jgi:inner membrane protein